MEKVKVGIIGTGNIAKTHVKSYQSFPDLVEVVACCDLDEEKAKRYAEKFDIPRVYTDYNEMMAKEQLDCVSVCTWNCAHAQAAIAAMRGGANVLCEKPMAMNAQEAKEMERVSKETGKLLQVGFVRRFGNDAEVVRRLSDAGELGDVYYVKANYLRRSGGPGGWFEDKSYSGGGPLLDLGVHVIDLAKYLAGNPKPVSVMGATFEGMDGHRALDGKAVWTAKGNTSKFKRDVEDLATAMIRFDNGMVMIAETSYTLNIPEPTCGVELYGTKSGVSLGGKDGLIYCTTQAGMYANVKPTVEAVFEWDAFKAEIRNFVEASKGEAVCRATARDGIEMMQILDAIYESARTGKQVIID